MNLIDCFVEEIISEPYEKFNMWWVNVKSDCYGNISEGHLMFSTEEKAKELKIGHKYLL